MITVDNRPHKRTMPCPYCFETIVVSVEHGVVNGFTLMTTITMQTTVVEPPAPPSIGVTEDPNDVLWTITDNSKLRDMAATIGEILRKRGVSDDAGADMRQLRSDDV